MEPRNNQTEIEEEVVVEAVQPSPTDIVIELPPGNIWEGKTSESTILNICAQTLLEVQSLRRDVAEIKQILKGMQQEKLEVEQDGNLLEKFPIKDEESLEDFNKQLLLDGKLVIKMASALKFSVGAVEKTVQNNVNSIMDKLFTDDLLKDFSIQGNRGKKPFVEFKGVSNLIWNVLKNIFPNFNKSVKEVLPFMGTFIKHAPSRVKAANKKDKDNSEST